MFGFISFQIKILHYLNVITKKLDMQKTDFEKNHHSFTYSSTMSGSTSAL